jgi:hypothetical protein
MKATAKQRECSPVADAIALSLQFGGWFSRERNTLDRARIPDDQQGDASPGKGFPRFRTPEPLRVIDGRIDGPALIGLTPACPPFEMVQGSGTHHLSQVQWNCARESPSLLVQNERLDPSSNTFQGRFPRERKSVDSVERASASPPYCWQFPHSGVFDPAKPLRAGKEFPWSYSRSYW